MKKLAYFLVLLFFMTSTATYFFTRKKNRTLLVVGCARSGTTYISDVLMHGGLDIGHERVGKDGISSWDLSVNPRKGRWNVRPANYHFAHIFHQVRDPLQVISSVYVTEDRSSWNYILKNLPEIKMQDSHLVKSAKYWYYWNLKAEKMAEWTYRLEDVDDRWDEFEQRLGRKIVRAPIDEIPKNVNTKNTENRRYFTWDDLEIELDPELYDNIRQLAKKYGY